MGAGQSADFDYAAAIAADKSRVYSEELDEEPEEGLGKPRRSEIAIKNGIQTNYTNEAGFTASTLWEIFLMVRSEHPSGDFLGARKFQVLDGPAPERTPEQQKLLRRGYKPSGYVERPDGTPLRGDFAFVTYDELYDATTAFIRGLLHTGATTHGSRLGIFCANRPEWLVAALGAYSQTIPVISLYPTLGANAIEFIIGHAETSVVVVSKENAETLLALAESKPEIAAVMKTIVYIDTVFDGRFGNTLDAVPEEYKARAAKVGVNVVGMSEAIATGAAEDVVAAIDIEANKPKSEDTAFIMYTSGTTGNPKGVVLSHKNVVATIASIKPVLDIYGTAMKRFLSFLPLAHIFETIVQTVVWIKGGTVYFSQGDTRFLAEDLKAVRPTLLPGVPRIFQKFYERVWAMVGDMFFVKRWFIYHAYNSQISLLRNKQPLNEGYDKKIFAQMREKMGLDAVQILVTGAAPCPPHIVEFMRVVTNAWFIQGYGMTECAAADAVSLWDDLHVGECGPPTPVNDMRLKDIPDMGHVSSTNPPTGEILIHGPNTFVGYYKNPEATEESYFTDKKGRRWYRTGDIGRWNPNGTISVIGRAKQSIKLGQGEFVALENIMDQYGKSPAVGQLWIYGNSYKTVLVAVACPRADTLYSFAVSKGWWKEGVHEAPGPLLSEDFRAQMAQLFEDAEKVAVLKEHILAELRKEEKGLHGFEKIKAIHLVGTVDAMGNAFTEENACLTPTMKLRPKQLKEAYLPQLQAMYTALGDGPKSGEEW